MRRLFTKFPVNGLVAALTSAVLRSAALTSAALTSAALTSAALRSVALTSAAALLMVSTAVTIPAVPGHYAQDPAATTGTAAGAPANLLLDPDAETGMCTMSGYDAMTIPGWTVTSGSPDSVCYGASGFARVGTPGPPNPGHAFFSGGATGDATMSQRVDVSSASRRIDQGLVTYRLAGWLGGWAGQNDRVGLAATFLDRAGTALGGALDTALGSATLAPVTNSDRDNRTALLPRVAAGRVPAGTRTIVVTLAFTWTAGNTTDGYADDLSLSVSTPVTRPVLTVPRSNVPAFDHVFFVFMENENALATEEPTGHGDYIVGNPAAPYLNTVLAPQGASLAAMYATTHPSDPNYLAITGGSTFGWTRNPVAGIDRISAVHLGDRLDQAGKTWKGYADGMFAPCDTTSHNTAAGGHYLADDEPFLLYADVVDNPDRCAAHNLPLYRLAADLADPATTPNLVWFAANDVDNMEGDNMEGGGVAGGDAWLRRTLPEIFNSAAWTTQRSLLIVSWDEGRTKAFGPAYPNHVATYVLASQGMVKPGYVSPVRYTDFSLGTTIEDALHIAPLTSNDKYATALTDIWTNTG